MSVSGTSRSTRFLLFPSTSSERGRPSPIVGRGEKGRCRVRRRRKHNYSSGCVSNTTIEWQERLVRREGPHNQQHATQWIGEIQKKSAASVWWTQLFSLPSAFFFSFHPLSSKFIWESLTFGARSLARSLLFPFYLPRDLSSGSSGPPRRTEW